ncbi:hypothetical protein MWH28_07805 [Natroniella sulfidigena]|uniref:hypothetical protein n=1 Tax=Natroniella sulfidigena TaxID=723921 RepID=UPI002009DD37|nr:hypothetical protein [Natroniella sulfidigena]MCK8817264.1 hypothetical protein [Natroniella sulfidigena]
MNKNNYPLTVVVFLVLVLLGAIFYKVNFGDGQVGNIVGFDTEEVEGTLFPIYGPDENLDETEVNFYIQLADDLEQFEKLQVIANRLSRFRFDFLPIKVLEIEEENGREIAVINLEEHQWNRNGDETPEFRGNAGVTWYLDHFQGAATGYFTSETLISSFLQPEYDGDWIDGVRFLYQGQPIREQDWDAVDLEGVFYRDEINN